MLNSGETFAHNPTIYPSINHSDLFFSFFPSLIEAVANCPQFSSLMSEDVVSAINKMIVQGAYYKPAAMEDPMVLEL